MTPTPRKQLKALLAQILNMPPSYVVWKGEPEPAAVKPAAGLTWALLRIGASSRNAIGWDDLRRTDNGDGTYSMLATGRRQIVLGCDLFSYAPALETMADDILEQLRSKPWHPDNLAQLNAMGLVYETAGPIIPLPTSVNGREISAAHLDMTVALAVTDAAKDPSSNTWIGEVLGTGTITVEGGGTVTQSIDVKGG